MSEHGERKSWVRRAAVPAAAAVAITAAACSSNGSGEGTMPPPGGTAPAGAVTTERRPDAPPTTKVRTIEELSFVSATGVQAAELCARGIRVARGDSEAIEGLPALWTKGMPVRVSGGSIRAALGRGQRVAIAWGPYTAPGEPAAADPIDVGILPEATVFSAPLNPEEDEGYIMKLGRDGTCVGAASADPDGGNARLLDMLNSGDAEGMPLDQLPKEYPIY